MIRRATEKDMDAMLEFTKALYDNLELNKLAKYNEDFIGAFLFSSIMDSDRCSFISDDLSGFIVGLEVPHWFSPDEKFAQELMYWVKPESRKTGIGKELVLAFEKWAKERGHRLVALSASGRYQTENTSSFYKKLGYNDESIVSMKEI